METIKQLQDQFIGELEAAIESQARNRVKSALIQMVTPMVHSVPRSKKTTKSAGRVLHGKYIGMLRGLAPNERRKAKLVHKLRGARAAIRFAKVMAVQLG